MSSSENIVLGVGNVYISPFATAVLPTIPADATSAITPGSTWTDLGYTQDGVKFNYVPKVTDVFVDQSYSAIQSILTGEECTLSASLAESTLKNLSYVIAASTYTSTSAKKQQLVFGGGSISDYKLLYIGKGPGAASAGKIVLIIHRVRSVAQTGMEFKKENAVIIPMQFKGLTDDTQSAGGSLAIIYQLKP